jgi:hypothetical protein
VNTVLNKSVNSCSLIPESFKELVKLSLEPKATIELIKDSEIFRRIVFLSPEPTALLEVEVPTLIGVVPAIAGRVPPKLRMEANTTDKVLLMANHLVLFKCIYLRPR